MTSPPDLSRLSHADKDALIRALFAQLHGLAERVKALEAENAALRERLNLPAKTPQNSSTPLSQGHKANSEPSHGRKGKAHPGAARALHPNPTRHCDVAATRCPQDSPHFQIAPNISTNTGCAASISANRSIRGRSRCSGMVGMSA